MAELAAEIIALLRSRALISIEQTIFILKVRPKKIRKLYGLRHICWLGDTEYVIVAAGVVIFDLI